jgi:catechol 2,3-dioxygenase-like lactoylglutathione lyase family enzyme
MGHLHLNTRDVAVQKQFWTKEMGAVPVLLGPIEGVKMPGAIILFKKADPSGGTPESVVQHFGVKVRDLKASMARVRAGGFQVDENKNGVQAFVTSPDGVKIELTEDKALTVPMEFHHIHFYSKSDIETKKWYVETFHAKPGRRAQFEAADLPGVNLTFAVAPNSLPTKGRALDHIGFEIKNLEAFCKELEAKGVKFDVSYRKVPSLGIAVAFFTDPDGTYIELTEGLSKL